MQTSKANQAVFCVPDAWPMYSNLTIVKGKSLPLLQQTPEIKMILRKGIYSVLQKISFKDAFPENDARADLTVCLVKDAATDLGFKDVVSCMHHSIEYAGALSTVACCTYITHLCEIC